MLPRRHVPKHPWCFNVLNQGGPSRASGRSRTGRNFRGPPRRGFGNTAGADGFIAIMLPLLALAGIMLAGGLIVGKFGLPRPVDTRMLIGGVMMISGLGFLFQGLAHLF